MGITVDELASDLCVDTREVLVLVGAYPPGRRHQTTLRENRGRWATWTGGGDSGLTGGPFYEQCSVNIDH